MPPTLDNLLGMAARHLAMASRGAIDMDLGMGMGMGMDDASSSSPSDFFPSLETAIFDLPEDLSTSGISPPYTSSTAGEETDASMSIIKDVEDLVQTFEATDQPLPELKLPAPTLPTHQLTPLTTVPTGSSIAPHLPNAPPTSSHSFCNQQQYPSFPFVATHGASCSPSIARVGGVSKAMSNSAAIMKRRRKPKQVDVYALSAEEKAEYTEKKQRRMLKNRESASASRKRKKQHLDQLEFQVKQLGEENEQLKSRLCFIEQENGLLKHKLSSVHQFIDSQPELASKFNVFTSRSSKTMLFMFSLLCFVFISPLTLYSGSTSNASWSRGHGRSLKSVHLLSHVEDVSSRDAFPLGLHAPRPLTPQQSPLTKWLDVHHQAVQNALAVSVPSRELISSSQNLLIGTENEPILKIQDSNEPMFSTTLQRRSDTSYIFCTEVQVLPAENPVVGKQKLAIVVPKGTNENPDADIIARFIQIDCDVANSQSLFDDNMTIPEDDEYVEEVLA